MHRLPPKSPSVGFDTIPSPSMSITARRSTIGVNYRPLEPRLSPTTPLRNEVSGLHSPPELEADEDDMGQGMEVDISAEFENVVEEISFERGGGEEDAPEEEAGDDHVADPQTPKANSGKIRDPGLRSSVHGKPRGPLPEDEEEEAGDESRGFQEPEYGDGGDPSAVADTYDDYSDAGGPEGGFEVNDDDDVPAAEDDTNDNIDNTVNNTMDDIDNTMDNIADNTMDTVDTVDPADTTGAMDDVGDDEGDLSPERRAVEEEEMGDEEAGDVTGISQERTPPKPKGRPKKKKEATTPRSAAEALPLPKRSRISQLPDSEFPIEEVQLTSRNGEQLHWRLQDAAFRSSAYAAPGVVARRACRVRPWRIPGRHQVCCAHPSGAQEASAGQASRWIPRPHWTQCQSVCACSVRVRTGRGGLGRQHQGERARL